ncbi:MAG: radical SAM protein [Oscillospiraceae bacterium]|nr:radical SAM protein [Oscillospiraceae bacterium]
MEYENIKTEHMTPEQLTEIAVMTKQDGNIGVAYTYNEPLIGYEFVENCSKAIHKVGLKNVLVTNGYINKGPLEELLPFIDAMNVDIKGHSDKTYDKIEGTLEPVIKAIEIANIKCHIEVTTLIIPNENENEVEDIAKKLAIINPNIPYHISRFFPRYRYSDRVATPPVTMYRLYEKAKQYLNNVYMGNMR